LCNDIWAFRSRSTDDENSNNSRNDTPSNDSEKPDSGNPDFSIFYLITFTEWELAEFESGGLVVELDTFSYVDIEWHVAKFEAVSLYRLTIRVRVALSHLNQGQNCHELKSKHSVRLN
jgi:hypothetical protein